MVIKKSKIDIFFMDSGIYFKKTKELEIKIIAQI